MAQLTVAEYDALEAAIRDGTRIVVRHRRQDVTVVPTRLVLRNRREALESRHPTTGDTLVIWIDEAERIEILR
ncbi:MAG TPA: hypothetical protein VG916_11410 [Gemmatimonadaceae bacterium]|nr:hypothetical protein [Gemmatimonadaceae bacterium]